MTTFPACINEAGQDHVAAELKRLGLEWDVAATCAEIEGRDGFLSMEPGDAYDYEISNFAIGKASYGVHGWIEILADKHVTFELADA